MATETASLLSSLNNQRNHVLGILDGLPDDALRQPVLPTQWTCLGMVRHLIVSDERFWFRRIVANEPVDLTLTDADYDAAWQVGPETTADSVFDQYRAEIAHSNEIITATSLDAPPAFWPDYWPNWRLANLREIILHVITETACHAGHLDAARELLDGRTWLAKPRP
jgi:uncharacterized damage-inducible protein DinB